MPRPEDKDQLGQPWGCGPGPRTRMATSIQSVNCFHPLIHEEANCKLTFVRCAFHLFLFLLVLLAVSLQFRSFLFLSVHCLFSVVCSVCLFSFSTLPCISCFVFPFLLISMSGVPFRSTPTEMSTSLVRPIHTSQLDASLTVIYKFKQRVQPSRSKRQHSRRHHQAFYSKSNYHCDHAQTRLRRSSLHRHSNLKLGIASTQQTRCNKQRSSLVVFVQSKPPVGTGHSKNAIRYRTLATLVKSLQSKLPSGRKDS